MTVLLKITKEPMLSRTESQKCRNFLLFQVQTQKLCWKVRKGKESASLTSRLNNILEKEALVRFTQPFIQRQVHFF